MRKQILLLGVFSLFLAGCGGGGKKITQNPADPPPPAPVPVVNVPPDLKGTIVFRVMTYKTGEGGQYTLYALSSAKGLEIVDSKAYGMSFSPDGRYLVYTRGQWAWETVIVDRNWNELAIFKDKWGLYYWFPSGSEIVFGYGQEGIYAITVGSWQLTKLVDSNGARFFAPAMPPDESCLVWSGYKEGESTRIYRASISDHLTITSPKVIFTSQSSWTNEVLTLFLDNRQIIIGEEDSIYLGDLGNNQFWQIAKIFALKGFKLSPDKTRLAVMALDSLYIYDTANWQEQKVGSNPNRSNRDLTWAPDGQSIVVLEEHLDEDNARIVVYAADGSKKTTIVTVPTHDRGRVISSFAQLSIDWAP